MNITKPGNNKLTISGVLPAGRTVQLNISTAAGPVQGYPQNFQAPDGGGAVSHTTATLPNGTYFIVAIAGPGHVETGMAALP